LLTKFQNAAKAKVYGIQAEIDINLPAGFKFISKYNYQKGTEETDKGETSPSRHAAPMFGTSHITYTNKKFMFDLYAFYTGEVSYKNLSFEERDKPSNYAKDANGNPYAPAWITLNFNAKYQFNKQFSITAAIENITDKRYRPYASGISAAGRNFMIAVRARF
jgi:hemoglobin/transferrin/lactoferrin receptor protein